MMKKYFGLLLIVLLLTGCKGKKYTVTFVDESGQLASLTVQKGANIKGIDAPTKDGYIFVSWLKDGLDYDVNTEITEDITLVANWTPEPELLNNHTVSFNFGDVIKTQTVADGELAVRPSSDPVKEKHIFLGWYVGETEYDFDTPVTKDIIIVAKYKLNRIVVKYDLDGGVGSTVETEIDKGSIPEMPKTPTKFGYDFVNWQLAGKPYNFDFPLNEDTTIKALWEPAVYVKVTYDTDGGESIQSEMLHVGDMLIKLPEAVKEGYVFKYWTLNGSEFDIKTKIDEDITLVAFYEAKETEVISDEPNE